MWLDAALIVLAGSLIGARLGYVLFNLAYFSSRPLEIPQVWLGGLSGEGAIFGGALTLALTAAAYKAPLLRLADWLYPLIPPLAIGAWLGCWLVGIAYGSAEPAGTWWAVPALDETGQMLLRMPLQLGAAVSLGVFYWLMETLTPLPRPSGWLFSLAASWLVLVCLVASLLRADPMPMWRELRVSTWSYLALLLPFFGLFTWLNFKAHHKK
jgi:prolipoprotein diacylglyceryltransferase